MEPREATPSGPLETRMLALLRAVKAGQHDMVVKATPGEEISSSFLRWYLLEAMPADVPAIARLELEQATIKGELNLRGASLKVLGRFINCQFPERIQLTDAEIIGLDFVGGTIEEIAADRLTATGSLRFLSPKFGGRPAPKDADAEQRRIARKGPEMKRIRLCGATVRGNLDFRGSKLGGFIEGKKVSPSLFADGITVNGNVLLCKNFESEGEICLNGAIIDRNLDCSAATLKNLEGYSLSAAGARISGSALLCQPFWRDKDDDDDELQRIFQSIGTVRLEGAKISGDLNCQNSQFVAAAFDQGRPDKPDDDSDLDAIAADGVDVGADLTFGWDAGEATAEEALHKKWVDADGTPYHVLGTISLISAKIGGDLILCDTRYHFPGEEVVCADGITVTGTTFLDSAYSNGVFRFVQATLKQGLSVKSVTFDVTQESQYWQSDTNMAEIELEGPACGIHATAAQVGSAFTWQNIEKKSSQNARIRLWLNLFGASAASVEDDESSWKAVDRFDVTGTTYGSISHLKGGDSTWRLRELDRQYALLNDERFPGRKNAWKRFQQALSCSGDAPDASRPTTDAKPVESSAARKNLYDATWPARCKAEERTLDKAIERFKPQPYLHLGRIFRTAGYRAAARDVLVRLERNQTRYSDISLATMFWRWMLDLTIKYGHALLRPIYILLVWVVLSTVIFAAAYDAGKIVQMKPSTPTTPATPTIQAAPAATATSPQPVPSFNPLIFALDTLVPIFDFNQKKNWAVNPLSNADAQAPAGKVNWLQSIEAVWLHIPDRWVAYLYIFNTLFGWLMTTLFVAGVSGLMRPSNDS